MIKIVARGSQSAKWYYFLSVAYICLLGALISVLLQCCNVYNKTDKQQHITTPQQLTTNQTTTLQFVVSAEDKYTVLALTYNRSRTLTRFIAFYAKMAHVDKIVILWNNVGVQIPFEYRNANNSGRVIILPQAENKLTNRMNLPIEVKTEAVFMVDDDLIVNESDLYAGFRLWKLFPNRLLGFFYTRGISMSKKHGKPIYNFWNHESYSIVLTGAAFMHRDHFTIWGKIPNRYYTMIDRWKNCEDIVMNFYLAEKFRDRISGLVMKAQVETLLRGHEKRLSLGRSGHFSRRTLCIRSLIKEMNFTLGKSYVLAERMGEES